MIRRRDLERNPLWSGWRRAGLDKVKKLAATENPSELPSAGERLWAPGQADLCCISYWSSSRERDWGMSCSSGSSVSGGCKIKFHYTATHCNTLQHTQHQITTTFSLLVPACSQATHRRPTRMQQHQHSEKKQHNPILFKDLVEEREIKVDYNCVPVRQIIRCRNMNYSQFWQGAGMVHQLKPRCECNLFTKIPKLGSSSLQLSTWK